MAYFVTQYRFDLGARHAAQKTAAHGHQRRIAPGARGERIHLRGIEYADFGHADANLISQTLARGRGPSPRTRLWRRDHPNSHLSLRGPFRQRKEDQRAAET